MQTFIHYRKFDKFGQITARGGLTLAIDQVGRNIRVAMAECGRKDNFDRKRGRTIAAGRLNSTEKSMVLQLPEDFDLNSRALNTAIKSFVHNQPNILGKVKKLLASDK